MKRTMMILISSLGLMVLLALFACAYLIPVLMIGNSQTNCEETLLETTYSPDGNIHLEAYRTEPGATVDFSVRVYVIKGSQKQVIYDAYHEYDAEIVWIDNSRVSINGRTLDISLGEMYDWHTQ